MSGPHLCSGDMTFGQLSPPVFLGACWISGKKQPGRSLLHLAPWPQVTVFVTASRKVLRDGSQLTLASTQRTSFDWPPGVVEGIQEKLRGGKALLPQSAAVTEHVRGMFGGARRDVAECWGWGCHPSALLPGASCTVKVTHEVITEETFKYKPHTNKNN